MSLDAWEEKALSSIADDLTASAPEFASRLSVFNRLTCGEQMPGNPRAKDEDGRRSNRHAPPQRGHRRGRTGIRPRARRSNSGAWPAIVIISIVLMTASGIVLALTVGTSQAPAGNGQAARCAPISVVACSGR